MWEIKITAWHGNVWCIRKIWLKLEHKTKLYLSPFVVAGNRKHDSWLQLAKFVNVTLIAWVTNRRSHWSLQSINCHSYRLYCYIRKLIIAIKRYIVETLSKRNTLCGNTNSRQITWTHFYQRKYETRVIVSPKCVARLQHNRFVCVATLRDTGW